MIHIAHQSCEATTGIQPLAVDRRRSDRNQQIIPRAATSMLGEVSPDEVIQGSRDPSCWWTNSAGLWCSVSHANDTSRMQSVLIVARLAFELESCVRDLVSLLEHLRDSCPDFFKVGSRA